MPQTFQNIFNLTVFVIIVCTFNVACRGRHAGKNLNIISGDFNLKEYLDTVKVFYKKEEISFTEMSKFIKEDSFGCKLNRVFLGNKNKNFDSIIFKLNAGDFVHYWGAPNSVDSLNEFDKLNLKADFSFMYLINSEAICSGKKAYKQDQLKSILNSSSYSALILYFNKKNFLTTWRYIIAG